MHHQEDYALDGSKDEQYFESYSDLNVHKVMLTDRPRMNFYRSILTDRSVVGDRLVVDVGAGSGILSCWAAQGGAAHVLSVEASSMAGLLRQVVDDNNLSDKITVVASTVEALIAGGVDAFLEAYPVVKEAGGVHLVVSEWMGFYLFHECMLASVLRARDFFQEVNAALPAKASLHLIPSHGQLRAAPVSLVPFYEEAFESFWDEVDGVRLRALGRLEFDERIEAASPLVEAMPERCLLHEGEVFWRGCFDTVYMDELREVTATRTFHFAHSPCAAQRLAESGSLVIDGFTLWFEVSFANCVLDTAPTAPPTHWKQTTVLLPRDVREAQIVSFDGTDEPLELSLCLTAQDLTQRYYTIEFELK